MEQKDNYQIKLSDVIDDKETSEIIDSTISHEVKQDIEKQIELIKILEVWKEEKRSDQKIKIIICLVVLGIVINQVHFINKLVSNIGNGSWKMEEWTFRLIVTGVFVEIVAIFKIIVTNLFPVNGSKDFLEFIGNFKKSEKSS